MDIIKILIVQMPEHKESVPPIRETSLNFL